MEGTREAIIQEILDWLKKVTKSSSILWLRGPTGHGKTALESTIAEICKRDGVLIASFFFSRQIGNCSDGKFLFTTMAAQLIQAFPWTKRYIDKAIREDPHIFGKALETQMKVLIAEPIQRIATMTRVVDAVTFGWMSYPTLIVIDGLDECAGLDVQDEIIRIIGDMAQQLHLPLRFLIASRPEPNLCAAFEKLQSRLSKDSISTLLLTEDAPTRRDIQIYLERKFNELRVWHSYLSAEWPGLDVIMRLVDKASGQFVYAKTIIIYISSPDDRPEDRLDIILKMPDTPVGDAPYAPLDQFYLHIVRSVKHRREVLLILGQVILAKEMSNEEDILWSLSNSTSQRRIEVILNLRFGDIKRLLKSLHSVIDVGEDLKLLHASFQDFLLNPARSKDHFVNLPEARVMLGLVYIRAICTRSCMCVPYQLCCLHCTYFFTPLAKISTNPEPAGKFEPDLSHIHNTLQNNLGHSFSHRSKHTGDFDDVSDAIMISAFRSAVRLARYDHPYLPICLDALARSLSRLFECTGDLISISSAISAQQWVVQLTPDGHPDMPLRLSNLGNSFSQRFQQTGDVGDISETVSAHCKAVELTRNGHPDMPLRLSNLGNSLSLRFERTGDVSDILDALSAQQRAIQLTPVGHADMPLRLSSLGNSLSLRFERTGDIGDILDAISAQQRAVRLTPDGHLDMSRCLSNLGSSLSHRFERIGDVNDILEATLVQQRAVQLTPDGHPDMPRWLNNLGSSLLHRFGRTGDFSDLSEAIAVQQRAVELTVEGHPDMPRWLSNLGNSFSRRFQQTGDVSDISKAVSAHYKALQLTPNGPDMPLRLSNLGNSLSPRFEQTGDLSDIFDAISAQQKALQLTPDGHPDMPRRLNNLGNSLLLRFELAGNVGDIIDAISAQQRAVQLTPEGHADMPSRLNSLGDALVRRFEHTGNSLDLEKAIDIYRRCASIISPLTSIRLRAALRWAELSASRDPSESLRGYDTAICLFSRIACMDHTFQQRYAELINFPHITASAASAAFAQGDVQKALEWLEEGRCVVWNQLKQFRTSIDDLRAHDCFLAQWFLDLSRVLEYVPSLKSRYWEPMMLTESLQKSETLMYNAVKARDWALVLDKIRSLPGFCNFLKPLLASAILKNLPEDGPVVLINVHENRCDALALIPGSDTPLHIPLVHFTLKQASKLADRLQGHLSFYGHRGFRPAPKKSKSDLCHILQELWVCVVRPILDALAFPEGVSPIQVSKFEPVHLSDIIL